MYLSSRNLAKLAKKMRGYIPLTIFLLLVFGFLFLTLCFISFHFGQILDIGNSYDPGLSSTYEKIWNAAKLYDFHEKPRIERMRFPFDLLSGIPIINGHLKIYSEVVGYFDPERNLIVIKGHCGTLGYEDGLILHELGHAKGWDIFCSLHRNCDKKINEYKLSKLGSEEYADEIGDDIVDTLTAIYQLRRMKEEEQPK